MLGRTISHYQIIEKLGEGGMGVVYKAKDNHLDRFVAFKVLPPEKVADPERRRRFAQEAKAASALNHPNIITIHDIDEADGVYFISMEFVAGKTLGSLIPRHGMRLGELLKYAIQVADALARAHATGIIHRDLKPGNVMVTEQGLVKVLDFGLAKLTETGLTSEQDATRTLKPATEEGKIVGTIAYMSPEQAEGKMIDGRSDIFSFGSVLYEMLTGRRAFQSDTKASTIAAILKEEPKPPSQIVEGLPREVERIVRRCLRKDPEQRFQTMADLKVALAEAKEESDSGVLESTKTTTPKRRPMLLWASAVAALLAAGVWFVRSRTATPEPSLVAVPLTSYPGTEDTPSFSPDGTQVAFQWCPENSDKSCHIYIKQVGVEPPFQLTNNPAQDFSPAWSPDGQTIAFLRILTPTKWGLILIPQRGGRERVLEEIDVSGEFDWKGGSFLAWARDSKWIVLPGPTEQGVDGLSLLSVETGEKRRLTSPAADVGVGDYAPAFSPDGRTLAFTRGIAGRSDLYVLHLAEGYKLQGEAERVALDNLYNNGAAWTADGGDVVFSSGTRNHAGLWRLPVRNPNTPRRLAFASDNASAPAVSRQGNRLTYVVSTGDTNIWRVDLQGPGGRPASPAQFISSTKPECCPSYSPNGKRIAFVSQRSGADEVWVCDGEGSNPVQLTSFGGGDIFGPRWSPDGGNIAFTVLAAGKVDIYAVNANGGKPRRLTSDQIRGKWPYWSRNGQWLYFVSVGDNQIWKMPAKGGEAVQITRNGGDTPKESPDGKLIYYSKGWPRELSVWKIPVEGGQEFKVLDSVNLGGRWTVGQLGIYYFTLPDEQGHSDIRLYEFSTGKIAKIVTIERKPDWDISVSPDGRTILYSQVDAVASDLMLVENFR
jgi:serine/threonine protein kinase